MDSTAERVPPSAGPPSAGGPGFAAGRPRRRRLAITAIIAVALVALYAVLGFFAVPAYVKRTLPDWVSDHLALPATVHQVRFNPFTLALTVRDLHISAGDHSALVGLEELLINLSMSSVVTRSWTFDRIRLRVPYVRISIDEEGELNLKQLAPRSVDEPRGSSSSVPPVIIEAFELERGVVEIDDRSQSTPYSLDIVPIHLTLHNFKTRDGRDSAFAFGAELDLGETIAWEGQLAVEPWRSNGRLALRGIKARRLWEYARDRLRVEIRDGTVQAEAAYHVEAGADGPQARVTDGRLQVQDLMVIEPGENMPLVALPDLTLQGVSADLPARQLSMAAVDSHGAALRVAIEADGRTNLQRLLTASGAPEAGTVKVDAVAPGDAEPPLWAVRLMQLTVEEYAVAVEDRRADPPVELALSNIRVGVEDLTYPGPAAARLTASVVVNTTGGMEVNGDVRLAPLGADVRLAATELPLVPFQPYLHEVANVALTSGVVDVTGRVAYQAGEAASLEFHGDARVADLKLLDTRLDSDLLNWERLTASQIRLRLPDGYVAIEEIVLDRPYAEVLIAKDGTVNVQTVMNESPSGRTAEAEADRGAAAAPFTTTIDTVRIVGGSAHFADLSLQPHVDTGIARLNGSIRGLSSKEQARAKVSLHGQVEKQAPVAIVGAINPFSAHAFTDLHVAFKNVNLTSLSPYSTKFAGYPIEKGKLSMDIDYRLSRGHLEADNQVVVDQLQLGNKVESPDATSLPVKFAVALLKDRHGRIDVRLPIRGDLNDPTFHYGRLIWKAVTNLFHKAVASPFTWLASLGPEKAEELSRVRFVSGRADLSEEGQQKLSLLARSLQERPALHLEVTGTADPEVDRAALREVVLRQQLTALQQGQAAARKSPIDQNPVKTAPPDEARWIEALYVRTFGALPADAAKGGRHAGAPRVPTDVLRTRLLEQITVDDRALRRLAQERAAHVQEFLLAHAELSADRIFLLGPRVDVEADGRGVPTQLSLAVP